MQPLPHLSPRIGVMLAYHELIKQFMAADPKTTEYALIAKDNFFIGSDIVPSLPMSPFTYLDMLKVEAKRLTGVDKDTFTQYQMQIEQLHRLITKIHTAKFNIGHKYADAVYLPSREEDVAEAIGNHLDYHNHMEHDKKVDVAMSIYKLTQEFKNIIDELPYAETTIALLFRA